jgi:putative selenate reductase
LAASVTLSTFHGCPADEIERICQFLLADRELDVIVKMNPPMLGRERLDHLLHDELGYTELTVTDSAYDTGLKYDEALDLVARLARFAAARGRRFGCKFSNTLEVVNHRQFFPAGNPSQYLSGQPLHVITMALTAIFRHAVGPAVPISFSAGVDRQNFPLAVACGFAPVSVCTDLLRPGGYGRLPGYLHGLADAMKAVGSARLDDFILDAFGQRQSAQARAADGVSPLLWAGLLNTSIAADRARRDPRYAAAQNRKTPVRIDSRLHTFDCITCDKCIPVCPNAANFTYPTPITAFDCSDVIVDPAGAIQRVPGRRFNITRDMQIANYADFCNECGNCDTFCPEYGGPYIEKPGFYSSLDSWRRAAPRDGFVVELLAPGPAVRARIKGCESHLILHDPAQRIYRWSDGSVELTVAGPNHDDVRARPLTPLGGDHRMDMWIFHTLRHLLHGVLDRKWVNQINAGVH